MVPFKCVMRSLSIITFFCFFVANALDVKDIVFVILSQPNKYHAKLAHDIKDDLHKQAAKLHFKDPPTVHLLHQDFPLVGGWTVIPLLSQLADSHKQNSSWIFFLQDNTNIILEKLLSTLAEHDENEEIWLGHALHDKEPTIIHHFAFYENPAHFKYPNVASGFAISTKLLQRLSTILSGDRAANADFSIDVAHELALFVWNKGNGVALKHETKLCIAFEPQCATYPRPFAVCADPIAKESIYFAVKTCAKFHKDRVPVVKNTWARSAQTLHFFSDAQDAEIPTINLGVPNTEQGHCAKTMAIIKYVSGQIGSDRRINWVVIADDDTILSVRRLRELLSCYDEKDRVALGERYGYNVQGSQGYNYITGGGGIVFSRPLFEQLSSPGVCDCPSLSSPDDMFLGICLAQLGVNITHSPLFHQARPMDYAQEYLQSQYPVSFHKHWMLDPVAVYKKWFVQDFEDCAKHDEL